MSTTALTPGRVYQVNHSRKGNFTGQLIQADDTWAIFKITQGKAKAILAHNEREVGEEVTVRRSFGTFTEMEGGTSSHNLVVDGRVIARVAKTDGRQDYSLPGEANARRLVACWNACEGISTEALERGPLSEAFEREQDRADSAGRQRDELLAVLHMALPALEAMRKQWPRSPLDDSMDVVEVVRAAIAKVEGGAA